MIDSAAVDRKSRKSGADTVIAAGVDVGSSAVKTVIVQDLPDGQPVVLALRQDRIRRREVAKVVGARLS